MAWWAKKRLSQTRVLPGCRACAAPLRREDKSCPRCGMSRKGKDPLVGQHVAGYQILERAGQGECGAVYQVKGADDEGLYALRLLRPMVVEELGGEHRLQTHIERWSRLSHPHIARLMEYDTADTRDGFYWVVEWLKGLSLGRLLRTQRTGLPFDAALSIMGQLCEALQAIHEYGYVHGQVRPGHVMLVGQKSHYRVKLSDVSWGRLFWQRKATSPLSRPKQLQMGWYLAPEQFMAMQEQVDGRTDLYACGVLLFQMLTGSPPFRGSSWEQIQHQHLYTPPPRLSVQHPSARFSTALEDLVRRALAKQPQDRFQSIQSFWQRLQATASQSAVFLRDPHDHLDVDDLYESASGNPYGASLDDLIAVSMQEGGGGAQSTTRIASDDLPRYNGLPRPMHSLRHKFDRRSHRSSGPGQDRSSLIDMLSLEHSGFQAPGTSPDTEDASPKTSELFLGRRRTYEWVWIPVLIALAWLAWWLWRYS